MSIYLDQIKLAGTIESVSIPAPVHNLQIDPETPISYSSDGSVKSRFKDSCWDFSVISSKGGIYVFETEKYTPATIIEIKTILYARIYWSPSIRSISSLRLTPILSLADWAGKNGISIQLLLNDKRLALGISSSLAALPRRTAEAISSLVNEITRIRLINEHFVIAPQGFDLAVRLRSIVESIPEERTKQTAVIPTRIYAELITNFSTFLAEFNEHSDRISAFYKFMVEGLKTGGHLKTPGGFKRWYKRDCNYQGILRDHGLIALSEKYDLMDKKRWNVYLREVQETSKYWIHLFTGMRDQEVNSLDRECLGNVNSNGISTKIIRGFTTKTIGSGASATYWITTEIIELGITASLSLGAIAAIQNQWELHPTEFPLLPTLFTRDKEKEHTRYQSNAQMIKTLSGTRIHDWLNRFPSLVVTEEDLAELYEFDGFRDWSTDVIIGRPWPITTHQCRRSLAVYLARSGLVSIGSMQLQFKHLLTAMTSYYRRNSAFAKNFILNEPQDEYHAAQINFIESIETEKRVAQFLDYEQSVINNQDNLWGGEGSRIRSAAKSNKPLIIVTDTNTTKRRFLDGEMAYKRGPIGGCTNLGPCDKVSISNVSTPCMACSNFIGDEESISKVETALNSLYKTRDKYPEDSLHYKQIQTDIIEFEAKLNKAKEYING